MQRLAALDAVGGVFSHWVYPGDAPLLFRGCERKGRGPVVASEVAGQHGAREVQPFAQGNQFFGGHIRRGHGLNLMGAQGALAGARFGQGFNLESSVDRSLALARPHVRRG